MVFRVWLTSCLCLVLFLEEDCSCLATPIGNNSGISRLAEAGCTKGKAQCNPLLNECCQSNCQLYPDILRVPCPWLESGRDKDCQYSFCTSKSPTCPTSEWYQDNKTCAGCEGTSGCFCRRGLCVSSGARMNATSDWTLFYLYIFSTLFSSFTFLFLTSILNFD